MFGWEELRDWRYYWRRSGLSLAIVSGHLLILWLVLTLGGITGHPQAREKALTVVDISRVEKPDAPAKPAVRVAVPDVAPVIILPAKVTVATPPVAAGNGTGQGCGMATVLAKAIVENPDAMAAVAALPDEVRSDSDAVMLWNGAWLDAQQPSALNFLPLFSSLPGADAGLASQDPVAQLKQVVLTALAETPADCRDVETIGPQFIPIAEADRTTMLVIGSGSWRWSSLLEPEGVSSDSAEPGQAPINSRLADAPPAN